MTVCPNCKVDNLDASNHCRGCGSALPGRTKTHSAWIIVCFAVGSLALICSLALRGGTSAEDKAMIQNLATDVSKLRKDIADMNRLQNAIADIQKSQGDVAAFLRDPKSKFGTYGIAYGVKPPAPATKPGEKPASKPAQKTKAPAKTK